MKSVKDFVANTKPALLTGLKPMNSVYLYRYDNVYMKGGATEVGCKELQEPYLKCALVLIDYAII